MLDKKGFRQTKIVPTKNATINLLCVVIIILFCSQPHVHANDFIEIIQKKSNKKLSVKILSYDDSLITFAIRGGKEFKVKPDTLTKESLEIIRSNIKQKADKSLQIYSKVNSAMGQPLFDGEKSLWKQSVKNVADRLGWPEESKTNLSSSYRYYPPMKYKFLGAHPYSAVLYGQANGLTSHISLVFANKGDFGSTSGMGPDHFKKMHPDRELPTSLENAIEIDAKIIQESLTSILGEPIKQRYGEKEDARSLLRWNLGEHALLLSEVKSEYTSLLIVTKVNADANGKVDFVKDNELRKVLVKNVNRKESGDTLIDNIPMVNQGPKGYCAPATFERAMRYMLIPADMYLLATRATAPGGGTSVSLLALRCKRIVQSKARKIRDLDLDEDLEIRKIKKFLDKGVPILWCMRSLPEYNKVANKRSQQRKKIKDFTTWKASIAMEASELAPQFEQSQTHHHICMIIGYNETTNELAVSDSWGPNYAIRWIHIDLARAVTSPGGFVIDI